MERLAQGWMKRLTMPGLSCDASHAAHAYWERTDLVLDEKRTIG
jgi:hypothetical protein